MKICLACAHKFSTADWSCPKCGHTPLYKNGVPLFAPRLTGSHVNFDPSYFSKLSKIEHSHFWFEHRNRLIIHHLKTYFPNASTFLEIGCGTGFVLSGIGLAFPDLSLSGSDIYPEGLMIAEQRVSNASFYQMDACRIPFMDEFDIIGAFDVLEHIDDDLMALFMIHRALKKDAGFIMTVPQHRWLWSTQDEYACHKRRYTRSEISSKLKTAGFKILAQTSFLSFLLPIMISSRAYKNITKSHTTAPKLNEGNLAPFLNRSLKAICSIEFFLIKYFALPMGGSILTIAKKG